MSDVGDDKISKTQKVINIISDASEFELFATHLSGEFAIENLEKRSECLWNLREICRKSKGIHSGM